MVSPTQKISQRSTGTNGVASADNKREDFFKKLAGLRPRVKANSMIIAGREQTLKDTWARVLAGAVVVNRKLPNGLEVRRFDSGNFPKYLPGVVIPEIRRAMEQSIKVGSGQEDTVSGEYLKDLDDDRAAIAPYYRVTDPNHIFFTAGISGAILTIQQLLLLNTGQGMLIPNLTYSTHLAVATMLAGNGSIIPIERDPTTGLPDVSRYSKQNNPFRTAGLATVVTHENPLPIVHTAEVYRNSKGTGLFDLAEIETLKDGIIRPFVVDLIYLSMSWPKTQLTIDKMIELADEKHILLFVNSLSKVMLEPGKRAGVIAAYVPKRLRAYAAGGVIRGLESLFDLGLNPQSYSSVKGLVAAHDILTAERDGTPHPTLQWIRGEARRRFIGEDGNGGNQRFMIELSPYLKPLYPNIAIESSGYNVFVVQGEDLPWIKPEYKKAVLDRVRSMMEQANNHDAVSAFDDYMKRVTPARMGASDILCADLFMETGVLFPPIDRFFVLGTEPEGVVGFRPVMIAEPNEFHKVGALIKEFFETRMNK
ncbi:MAG: aminotransferase class I/II-fold pyridoxal phosphate-dependent enzyme [Candidatus Micrarchaeota archaeon]|nr:aminotransferase class I/II-fold pyridoxal phosphate-dependent enzyme [Candidatus Micrarchaeota archaeon]